jgi:hypothetical protein
MKSDCSKLYGLVFKHGSWYFFVNNQVISKCRSFLGKLTLVQLIKCFSAFIVLTEAHCWNLSKQLEASLHLYILFLQG